MNKEFVDYKTALAFKELGFDEPCFGGYVKLTETQNTFFMNDVISEIDRETPLHKDLITKAPLYQQAFRWFREKYGMHHGIGFNGSWYYDIDSMKNCDEAVYEVAHKWDMKTYEEAEQACLDKLIEIVKKNAHI